MPSCTFLTDKDRVEYAPLWILRAQESTTSFNHFFTEAVTFDLEFVETREIIFQFGKKVTFICVETVLNP